MNLILRTITLIALFVPTVSTAAAQPQTQPVKIDYRDRYSVLTDRNMFLRDRRRAGYTREPTSRPVYAARPVEESLILTGVVVEDGEFRAYFEDTLRSTVLKLRVNESVASGIITEIQMDAVEYLNGDRRTWIDVGHTLTGSVPPPGPSRSFADMPLTPSAPGGTTQPANGAAVGAAPSPLPNPDDPGLTMEEKMKIRRAQQLNGGR